MRDQPSFYLASTESVPLLKPRACFAVERLVAEGRDDYLRVRIEPPMLGQAFKLRDQTIDELVLATRYAATTLFPVSEWPMMVFVCRILNDKIRNSGTATPTDLEVVLIGQLYPTLDAANEDMSRLDEHHYRYI